MSDFYSGRKWRGKAARVLSRHNYVDQVKKRYGKLEQADMVHHALPLEDFPEYAFHDNNLIPVSRATHRGLHNDDGTLTAAGIEVARRAARLIGIDIADYIASQKPGRRQRNDQGRYPKNF